MLGNNSRGVLCYKQVKLQETIGAIRNSTKTPNESSMNCSSERAKAGSASGRSQMFFVVDLNPENVRDGL